MLIEKFFSHTHVYISALKLSQQVDGSNRN